MAFDGIVTKCIINELNSSILDGKINKIFEPNKNELLLDIYCGGKNYALNICIDSFNCRINLTTHSKPNPSNALNFCMVLRKHILGYRIKNISSVDLERIIFIELEGYNEFDNLTQKKLVVELMGKHSNVIILNDDNVIIDSLRHLTISSNSNRDIIPGKKYIIPENNKYSFLNLETFNDFYNIIAPFFNIPLDKSISSCFTGFSMSFIQNELQKLKIKNNDYSKENLNILYNDIKKIISNISNLTCKEYINNKNKADYVLSINNTKTTNLDVNFYIDDFYYEKNQNELFVSYRNNLLKLILNYLKKYKNRLKTINNKLIECERKEHYRLYGELITANLYKIKDTNITSISLENYYDNNTLITIPLDKKYSVSDNAKRYFKKYNKLKNAFEICTQQKDDTENELNYIESIVYEIENARTVNDIDEIYSEISENSIFSSSFKKKNNKKKISSKKKTSINPLEFEIDGYTVLIGKNNICNDYLTTKIANKNDLWFHTKEIHGSHVVLKLDNTEPDEDIILKCAQIAAFHSKAKLSSNVPVDYCYIKYVKKPNKSKPGMVIYTHNKTLYVTPKEF